MRGPLLGLILALPLVASNACTPPRTISDIQLRFDPQLESGFYSLPMPNDARRLEDDAGGRPHPNYWDFPNPTDSEQLTEYLSFLSTEVEGFGLNSGTFFSFTGPIAALEWDSDNAAVSQRCEGPVRIVDVDPDSPDRGRCIPAQIHWVGPDSLDPYLAPNTFVVAPWWGFPLRPATAYAIVLVALEDEEGGVLQAPDPLLRLLESQSGPADLSAAYAPLAEFLADQPQWLNQDSLAWISAATVFTTGHPTEQLASLAEAVRSHPTLPSWNNDEGLTQLTAGDDAFTADYPIHSGSYQAINFQTGDIPYATEGGGFVFEDGVPAPQWDERIPFALSEPNAGFEQPEAGWPVLLHAHGTGGDRYSHLSGGQTPPAKLAAARGFVSIGIPQPIHGERWPDGNGLTISLYSFNYFNPASGISMFRQGAVDTISLLRFVQENLTEGGPIAQAHPDLRIDPDNIYFLGHSQGGITGAMILPFAGDIGAWVLSGAGGGVSMTVMQREDPLVIRDAMLSALDAPDTTELFAHHPVIGLIQTIVEPSDPLNYAPLWIDQSEGSPTSVLLTEGLHDAQTPADTTEALAVAGRLAIALPYHERDIDGLMLRGLDNINTPYSGTSSHPSGAPVTAGLAQFDGNHFAIFNDSSASLLYANFLWSQLRDGPPGEIGGNFP
jgi:hypothetical protein